MNADTRSVAGLAVLVTGAGSGMGRATAELFAAEGALVAVTDQTLEAARAVAEPLGELTHAWKLDVSDAARIAKVTAAVASHFGRLDILINNAGIAAFRSLDDADYDQVWQRVLSVNLTAHQRLVRAALPWLRQSPSPRIVNIASTEALGATPGNSPYAAAKAGVIGLTRALAVDLGREGITVNCICPGPIETGMTATFADADKQVFARRRTALRRYGLPMEVAQMTLNLCLPGASYITGAVIPVDGGLMARNA